jgi:hypothetical protein
VLGFERVVGAIGARSDKVTPQIGTYKTRSGSGSSLVQAVEE